MLLVGAFVGILSLLIFGPFVYNHHIFPLGRLQNRIHVGDKCVDVEKQFAAYYAAHQNAHEIYFNKGERSTSFLGTPITPSRYLSLYHVNLFDDVQLNVICDSLDDRVAQVQFIGD